MRACFQVLVIPYRFRNGQVEFAVLRRNDSDYWQFVAGGGEEGETPIQAARREAGEEAGIDADGAFAALDTLSTIPRECFAEAEFWPADVYVIPEYCFATEVGEAELRLSGEHAEARWLGYEDALQLLNWDSNCTALWELNERLKDGNLAGAHTPLDRARHGWDVPAPNATPRASGATARASGATARASGATARAEGDRMGAIEKIAVLDNAIEARALDSVLTEQAIPHALISYHDTAYDGIYQGGRGWGHVEAPAEFREEILAAIEELHRAGQGDENDDEGGPEQ